MLRLQKGMRLRSRRELSVKGIITFSAPCSGGFVGVLPAGEVLLVDQDSPKGSTGAWLVPERYEHFETAFVQEKDRRDPEYDGYAVGVSNEDAARDFEIVEENA